MAPLLSVPPERLLLEPGAELAELEPVAVTEPLPVRSAEPDAVGAPEAAGPEAPKAVPAPAPGAAEPGARTDPAELPTGVGADSTWAEGITGTGVPSTARSTARTPVQLTAVVKVVQAAQTRPATKGERLI